MSIPHPQTEFIRKNEKSEENPNQFSIKIKLLK